MQAPDPARAISGPSLSVVVVAHDSLPELRRTLPPLRDQLRDGDELIVVDNASRDAVADELVALAPDARLVSLPSNLGFAEGANAGAAVAEGELLVLLNPDALVNPGWAEAIRAPWGGEWEAWMGLVLLGDGTRINSSGGVLHFTGFGWAGQIDEPSSAAPSDLAAVGFLSGACLAVPRARWVALRGFAPRFFMYCEDVDLSLRMRLAGGRLAVVPQARVTHSYEFAKGGYKWRLLERNRWATILRTYPPRLLALLAPVLLATELVVWQKAVREGWATMKARATVDVVLGLGRLWRERREIQAQRTITEARFAAALTAELSSPYFGAIGSQALVRGALGLYWRGVGALIARERR